MVKFCKTIVKTAVSIGSAVASVGAVAVTINNNKEEIKKTVKVVKDVKKNRIIYKVIIFNIFIGAYFLKLRK